MNWLYRLERKFGKYAIANLPLYIVILYAIGAVLDILSRGRFYFDYLSLNPYLVLRGQVWRLFTFLMASPSNSIIFIVFVLLFYYSVGQSLVQVWGDFKFNMYILTGILGTIAAAFLTYVITRNPFIYTDTYYLNLSMFLAYASVFPEMRVYLYGLLPIKVKWLAYLDVALLVYGFLTGGTGGRVAIVVSLLNFLLFYFSTRNYRRVSPKEVRRKVKYKKAVQTGREGARHRCAVCKRTELDDPNLEFRYCSKCNGNYEYCNEHLFTHVHIK
ncbi:MAG: rhomboid family intramembrane serine protease [Eubacteriales bacterium]|nr:rhomboid family intramembrane serine protease [Eubacteriales bacterium]